MGIADSAGMQQLLPSLKTVTFVSCRQVSIANSPSLQNDVKRTQGIATAK